MLLTVQRCSEMHLSPGTGAYATVGMHSPGLTEPRTNGAQWQPWDDTDTATSYVFSLQHRGSDGVSNTPSDQTQAYEHPTHMGLPRLSQHPNRQGSEQGRLKPRTRDHDTGRARFISMSDMAQLDPNDITCSCKRRAALQTKPH